MSATSLSGAKRSGESWAARVSNTVGGVFEAMSSWHTRRRQRRQLESLDDRMLSDIGLSRADIDRVFEKPFWRF